ncbi:MAG: hypothetical protein ACK5R2_01805 [Cyanobacteriota bacterium]|jgi:hypothetical protein
MTFVLRQKRFIERRITGLCGNDPYDFIVHIKVLPDSRARQLRRELVEAKRLIDQLADNPALELTNARGEPIEDLDRRIAEEVLCGWGPELVDEDGMTIPFNEDNKAAVLDLPGLAANLAGVWVDTYQESVKNSASSQPSGADLSSDQTQKD